MNSGRFRRRCSSLVKDARKFELAPLERAPAALHSIVNSSMGWRGFAIAGSAEDEPCRQTAGAVSDFLTNQRFLNEDFRCAGADGPAPLAPDGRFGVSSVGRSGVGPGFPSRATRASRVASMIRRTRRLTCTVAGPEMEIPSPRLRLILRLAIISSRLLI